MPSRETTIILILSCACLLLSGAAGDDSLAAAAAAAGPANAPAQTKVNHAAGLAGTTQNGTRNGVGNAGILIKVGGTASLAQSTDGTGNGITSSQGSGNNNGNNASGNGNGNGNGNNNAQITIINDPAFLTCPPCQYYDPTTQICTTVQTCLSTKQAAAAVSLPASPPPAAAVNAPAAGTFVTATGRKLLL